MAKTIDRANVSPVAFTDEVTGMADYVRSAEGRAAIERGIADIHEGRFIEGEDALAIALQRRAEARRHA